MTAVPRLVTTLVAALEAVLLIGYAVSITVVVATEGLQGPQEVSSASGVAVEIVVFLLFGVGCALVALGRWRGAGWAAVPFVVIQLLALTVSIPLATGAGGGVPVGVIVTVAALAGLGAMVVGRLRPDQPDSGTDDRPAPRSVHADEN